MKIQNRYLERYSAKKFWTMYKKECIEKKLTSKHIFYWYKSYCDCYKLKVLPEFIFRTFIRKN